MSVLKIIAKNHLNNKKAQNIINSFAIQEQHPMSQVLFGVRYEITLGGNDGGDIC
ncbi:hypothetical protein D3C72_2483510 [compost metagenome]